MFSRTRNSIFLALVVLLAVSAFWGNPANSPAQSLQESFRGSFYPDPSAQFDPRKDTAISSAVVFVEKDGGKRYGAVSRFLFSVPSKREYIVNGISLQKHLPQNPKSDDYRRLTQSAWPDLDAKQLKLAAKQVATWVKKNPNTPLLLMTSIRRADLPGKLNRSPIDVPGEVQASKLIRRVDPVYPEAAKRARMSGRVVLTVGIDEQGNVEEITVKSGHPLLAAASIIAVQQWKYSPLLINGEPFPVVATVTTVFNVK